MAVAMGGMTMRFLKVRPANENWENSKDKETPPQVASGTIVSSIAEGKRGSKRRETWESAQDREAALPEKAGALLNC
jgi:hypothetical protein